MADKKVKWDKDGNPVMSGKGRARRVKESIMKAVKADAMPIGVGIIGGGVATGLGTAIANNAPMLKDWVAEGGLKRSFAVGLPSVGLAGLGLFLASKTITTPKKAAEVGPFVVGAAATFSLASTLGPELIDRVDAWASGFFAPSPGGGNAGMSHGARTGGTLPPRRRALMPDEVSPGGGNAGSSHGARTGGTIPRRTNRW